MKTTTQNSSIIIITILKPIIKMPWRFKRESFSQAHSFLLCCIDTAYIFMRIHICFVYILHVLLICISIKLSYFVLTTHKGKMLIILMQLLIQFYCKNTSYNLQSAYTLKNIHNTMQYECMHAPMHQCTMHHLFFLCPECTIWFYHCAFIIRARRLFYRFCVAIAISWW